ncbi:MAG: hypothetical protein IJX80_03680 [Clostridia bacterium]|nr:hypothetical protein [Clostridia bacterium]
MKRVLCILLSFFSLVVMISCSDTGTTENADYSFQKGNVVIAVNGEMAPILEALGEWIEYNESPSCGFTGMSKLYTYAGFDIETYPTDGKDYVYRVELYDDSVATKEGIRVGSTKAQVIEAYGNASEEGTTVLTYRAKNMYLRLLLSAEGLVSKIQYLHPNAVDN